MRRKIKTAIVGGATLAVAVALAAPAGAQPVGGCPAGNGWTLESVANLLATDNGNQHDQNGDGYICAKVNNGQSAKYGYDSWTVKDNTNPLPAV